MNMFIACILFMLTFLGTQLERKTRPWLKLICKQHVCAQNSALRYLFSRIVRKVLWSSTVLLHQLIHCALENRSKKTILFITILPQSIKQNSIVSSPLILEMVLQSSVRLSARGLLVIQTAFFLLLTDFFPWAIDFPKSELRKHIPT